jgi:predicted PurR-regulated permease PerM
MSSKDSINSFINIAFGWLENLPVILSKGINSLLDISVGFVISIYFLLGKETFINQVKKVNYAIFKREKADNILGMSRLINNLFSKFILGKIIDSLIIGIISFPFMLVIYRPYALLISFIIGVTNVIPFFGPVFGAVLSAIIILISAPQMVIWFLIFILVLQQFDGNILGPKILGDSTGLPPVWVMLGILIGGQLFGFVGMVVGVPVTAVLYLALRTYINLKYEKRQPEATAAALKEENCDNDEKSA